MAAILSRGRWVNKEYSSQSQHQMDQLLTTQKDYNVADNN